mmetsp:Transcript_9135/g.33718  ORF Transcript_9135/g.33718 Transcript_9135/m.33718 type:complete len:898 (-) Transcript_9135:32-2725(-)
MPTNPSSSSPFNHIPQQQRKKPKTFKKRNSLKLSKETLNNSSATAADQKQQQQELSSSSPSTSSLTSPLSSSSSNINNPLLQQSPIEDITYFPSKAVQQLKRKRPSIYSTFNRMSLSPQQHNRSSSSLDKNAENEPLIYSNPEEVTYDDSLLSASSDEQVDKHNGKKRKTDANSFLTIEIQFPKGLQLKIDVDPHDTFHALSHKLLKLANKDQSFSVIQNYLGEVKSSQTHYEFMARGPQAFEKAYGLNSEDIVATEYNNSWPAGTRLGVEECLMDMDNAPVANGDMEISSPEPAEDKMFADFADACPATVRFELNGQTTGSKDLHKTELEKVFQKADTLYTVAEYVYEKTGVDSFYLRSKEHVFKDIKKYTTTQLSDLMVQDGGESPLQLWAVVDPTIDIQTMHFSESELEKYAYQEKPSVLYRAKYIPLRPTLNERYYLDLLKSAVSVGEYTTDVDTVIDVRDLTKTSVIQKRMMKQMKFIHGFLTGIALSVDFKKGCELAKSDESFSTYSPFFTKIFEIGRRHKIRNPEKMKSEYGKLLYMLQDARSAQIRQQLGFDVVDKVKTVHHKLKKANVLSVLEDPNIEIATKDIIDDGQSRYTLERTKKDKYKNIDRIARRFRNSSIDEEEIKTCLYSIVDANCYLNQCARPIEIMLGYLQEYFSPTKESYGKFPAFSCLSIMEGQSGARLTHSHIRQYQFVLQSLMLWKTIIGDMYRLWFLAEEDLLDMENSPYELKNTGQGFHRMQNSPRVYKAMLGILAHVKKVVGRENWIGASRIHVGDNNVPNALTFIDKYNAVPKIISTIICVLENVKKIMSENRGIKSYIESTFGSSERVKVMILQDFFKHAFDGSGADTFDSSGSCVDGRTTSAWNWTQQLTSKPFYPVFQLAGFTSFEA